jgi:hypothetical protein
MVEGSNLFTFGVNCGVAHGGFFDFLGVNGGVVHGRGFQYLTLGSQWWCSCFPLRGFYV